MMFELQTERLTLRPPQAADFAPYAALCNDAEVMRYLGGIWDEETVWRHLAFMIGHWQLRGYGLFAVIERQSGQFLGRVGYINPAGYPGFEVGWTLARAAWGQGYATEAAQACVDHAFDGLKREDVISLINPGNEPSEAVARRLRETPAEKIQHRGEALRVWRITRQQWLARS